jgi:hypothetical protein
MDKCSGMVMDHVVTGLFVASGGDGRDDAGA